MAKDKSSAAPGDTVELADKDTSFYDPETQLDISREQTAKLEERIGKKTHIAIVSGRLLVVGSKGGKKAPAAKEAE